VTNNTSSSDLKRFRDTVDLFKKYGHEYNFDWLILEAQAYQESHIDQSVRSPSGAVGVMQIKPSTAAGNPINIKGVDQSAANNIHAGVKYLRVITDRYFKNDQTWGVRAIIMFSFKAPQNKLPCRPFPFN
jgi:membrane-bound lytic murein transglycosylase MltF